MVSNQRRAEAVHVMRIEQYKFLYQKPCGTQIVPINNLIYIYCIPAAIISDHDRFRTHTASKYLVDHVGSTLWRKTIARDILGDLQ